MKNIVYSIVLLSFAILLPAFSAEISNNSIPLLGAQVVIESGQSAEEIESLFVTLKNNNMNACRIRMFESYMHDGNGNWDFKVFDYAFESAKRHNIMIFATLFPMVEFTNIGGFKFPDSQEHLTRIAEYIKKVVTHYKTYPAFAGWVLMNEIGTGKAPFSKPLTAHKFAEWQKTDSIKPFLPNGKPVMQFQEERFLLDYNTWYLTWLKSEVRKYDAKSHLHVNTHAIFDTYSEYDFTKWRSILDSFGGSAHASWHFGNFTRNNYHYAMAANSEIIRSGAGGKPWIMTELQGGNNIWSGGIPMCPTANEIEQWMWTVIGTGGKGLIFWSLNARTAGIEAGEWAMLDLQNQPTDRLETAAKVAGIVKQNADFFAHAKVVESGVNILYTRESLWSEQRAETTGSNFAGRKPGAAIKSVIGFYESLAQMGIQANIKCVDEFDFTDANNKGKVIVLAHQIALSAEYASKLETFAKTGGTVVVEGLTAFYNQFMQLQLSFGNPFESLLGGNLKEVKMLNNQTTVQIQKTNITLPVHWWQGTIDKQQSRTLAQNIVGHTIATENTIGQGKVIWLPSMVALAARERQDNQPLCSFIQQFIMPKLEPEVLYFNKPSNGLIMHQLIANGRKLLVIINKSTKSRLVKLNNTIDYALIYSTNNRLNDKSLKLEPEATLVLELVN